jgi:hypothetical protein
MLALLGYLAGVAVVVSAFALGAMKLTQPLPEHSMPATSTTQAPAAQPDHAIYAAQRQPPVARATTTAKRATAKRAARGRAHKSPSSRSAAHDAPRALGYAEQSQPLFGGFR